MQKYSYAHNKVVKIEKEIELPACPTQVAMEIIGGKWTLVILHYLANGEAQRYKQLEYAVDGITPKMLIKELKHLESKGIVKRTQYNTIPPIVEYQLTQEGKDVLPILEEIVKYGNKIIEKQKHDKHG